MSIVAAASSLQEDHGAVRLARYAQRIGYPECAFFGVRPVVDTGFQCREIWTKEQRDTVAFYLREAQQEIEDELGYFLQPHWVVGQTEDEPGGDMRLVDVQLYRPRLLTRWAMVIAGGVRAVEDIGLAAAVDHAADPAVVGPLATTATDADELVVYHPGTALEIVPSKVTLAGAQVTIEIPRCRLVTEAASSNPATGLDYNDLSNFEATVDVKRVYNDHSTNAVLVAPHTCDGACLASGCGEYTQDGCIYVRRPEAGSVDVMPATYSGGTWQAQKAACWYGLVRLNYLAGLRQLTPQMEDAVIRLAHAKMPEEPCGCEVSQRLWRRDRHVPAGITRERANCPFGLSDGAWMAWRFVQSNRTWRLGVM